MKNLNLHYPQSNKSILTIWIIFYTTDDSSPLSATSKPIQEKNNQFVIRAVNLYWPGKFDDSASRTRLVTLLGARGNTALDGDDVAGVCVEGEGWLPSTLPIWVLLVRRRAIAANVSNNPAGLDCSMEVELVAEAKLGTLTLIDDGPRPLSFCSLFSLSLSLSDFLAMNHRTGWIQRLHFMRDFKGKHL